MTVYEHLWLGQELSPFTTTSAVITPPDDIAVVTAAKGALLSLESSVLKLR